MFTSFLVLGGSYFLGAIPSGYWLTKFIFHHEVPVVNGQMGTKYILRNLGFRPAFFTFLMDFMKGFFPVWLAVQLLPGLAWFHGLVILSVILGHNYSIFLDFRGGKGIASSFGCFAVFPLMLPFMIIIHYLANELCKRSLYYGTLPLALLVFITLDPYRYFTIVPSEIRIAAILTIFLFIIKTNDDPMFIDLRKQ